MKKTMKELQKIKGVGKILTKRFIKAGYNSYEAIVAAGEEGLQKIKGVNPRMIPSIIKQATALSAELKAERARKVAEFKTAAAAIRKQVEGIARAVKERAGEELQGGSGSRTEAQLRKMLTALEKVEGSLEKQVKGTRKRLAKAGEYLATLSVDKGIKQMGSGLKKARKSLKRIYE